MWEECLGDPFPSTPSLPRQVEFQFLHNLKTNNGSNKVEV